MECANREKCIELETKEKYFKLVYDYSATGDLTAFKFNGDGISIGIKKA